MLDNLLDSMEGSQVKIFKLIGQAGLQDLVFMNLQPNDQLLAFLTVRKRGLGWWPLLMVRHRLVLVFGSFSRR